MDVDVDMKWYIYIYKSMLFHLPFFSSTWITSFFLRSPFCQKHLRRVSGGKDWCNGWSLEKGTSSWGHFCRWDERSIRYDEPIWNLMQFCRLGLGKMLGRNSVNALVCYKIVLYSNILKGCFCDHAKWPRSPRYVDWQQIPTIIAANCSTDVT